MPRLRQVPRRDVHARAEKLFQRLFGERDPVEEPGTATGTPGNWWSVFALVPEVFDHALAGFRLYRSPERKLDPVLRELGQTRAGFARGSRFVFSQHCKSCRGLGIPEEKIRAIPAWASSELFTPLERAVLAYTDDLVLAGGRVPDATFARLQAELSDEAILELTYIVGLYAMHATMSRALRLEYDDVDDPVAEVPAPEGSGGDAMQAVDPPRGERS